MILESTQDLKKYISIADSFVFDDFQPYIKKAVNTFTKRYVGKLHEILSAEATGENSDVKNEAREHLQNAIANFGWFIYLPTASVMMDSSGISVSQNENRKAADFWQIKDIRREALRSGHEAMDLLLEVLEDNPSVFTDYAENYSSINNELLVNNATTFSKWYNINDSRQVYLALQPTLRLVEDQYLKTFLCKELIDILKATPDTTSQELKDVLADIKEPIQKAMVLFSVSKVASTGLFELSSDGLRLNFESYLGARKQSVDYGKATEQVKKLTETMLDNATIYMSQVKETIIENLSLFNMCESPLKNYTTASSSFETYNTQGITGI